MALSTYSGLQAAIALHMKRSDLTTEIADFIALAEQDIGRKLSSYLQETVSSLTTVASVQEVALPTGCTDVKWVKLVGTDYRPLTHVPAPALHRMYTNSETGIPQYYHQTGSNLVIYPIPADAYTLSALCILPTAALSVSAPTNTMLTNYPNLYLYGALVHGFRHIKHTERMQIAQAAFNEQMNDAKLEARKLRTSGTPDGIRSMSKRRIV